MAEQTKGEPRTVYFSADKLATFENLEGRSFKLVRHDGFGNSFVEIYEVPESITQLAREATEYFLEVLNAVEEVEE